MRTSISSIVQKISKASAAVGLSFALVGGGAAFGGTPEQRIQAEMNRGKDYVAARDAAARFDVTNIPAKLVTKAQKALDEMAHGRDYVGAREATGPATAIPSHFAATQVRIQTQLNAGKDYVSAREAAETPPPVAVRLVSTSRPAR